jgi:DNA end-binding protein Ku
LLGQHATEILSKRFTIMRSIWSGNISFGLVNIPIKLYTATEDKNLDFDYLHKKDFSPIRYAKVCEHEEKEINYKEIVRGYEYRDGDFVVITEEDLQRASPEKTKSIQILSFTDEDQITSEYYDKPYFMEPEKNAQKAYYLFLEALKQSKKVAVAKFLLRSREALAVLKPHFNIIVLNKIRFPNEIRDAKELNVPKQNIEKGELDMAISLIDKLSKPFNPKDYPDTYKENLKKTIERKAKGKPLPKIEEKEPARVKNLMELLKESLNEQQNQRPTLSA